AILTVPAEYHLTGRGLQNTGNRDVHVFTYHSTRIVHDDHRTVVEVGHSLIVLLPLLQNEHLHYLTGQHNRFERIGQLVDIQDRHSSELSNLVQVEIVGYDLTLELSRQLDQLVIDIPDVGKIRFTNDDFIASLLLLHPLQNIQSPAPAISLDRVRAVGYLLQFTKNKLRNYQRP